MIQSINSYLANQLILLRDNGNLNKTIINQWAVNNGFMEKKKYLYDTRNPFKTIE